MHFGQEHFRVKHWDADHFGNVAVVEGEPFDVYAWFPTDRIPTGRRYEEYTEEEPKSVQRPKRRKRRPIPVSTLPPFVVEIPPLDPLPQMVPAPQFGAVPPAPPPPQPSPYESAQSRQYAYWAQVAAKARQGREMQRGLFHAKAVQRQQQSAARHAQLVQQRMARMIGSAPQQ